jgi:hypothetical protein
MSHSSPISLNTKLQVLLLSRKSYIDKIKQIDEQIINTLRESTPSSNTECIQIIGTALAACSLDFDNTLIESPRPNKPSVIIAQRNRVLLNYPGFTELTTVSSSQSTPPTVSTSQPSSTDQSQFRAETPTRNLVNFAEFTSPETSLEDLLSNINP